MTPPPHFNVAEITIRIPGDVAGSRRSRSHEHLQTMLGGGRIIFPTSFIRRLLLMRCLFVSSLLSVGILNPHHYLERIRKGRLFWMCVLIGGLVLDPAAIGAAQASAPEFKPVDDPARPFFARHCQTCHA